MCLSEVSRLESYRILYLLDTIEVYIIGHSLNAFVRSNREI